jgi:glycerophosphoryl diester phosphodiesterase
MTNPTRPLVWGHRGAMDFAPQNTLPSFRIAEEQGADGVELDVQLTKDGVLVVFHDARVDDLTDGRGPLDSYTWSDLRRLDAGSHFDRSWRGTPIPTLEEVLASLDPRTTVNVELKTALSEEAWWDKWLTLIRGPRRLTETRRQTARTEARPLAEAVARVLKQKSPERFVISSFDPLALDAMRPLVPEIPLGFLHSPTVPWDTPALMAAIPHEAWHPHYSQVTAKTLAAEKAEGRRVNVWTVNDPLHAVKLAQLGVDAVITNRPGEVLKALGEPR